ncbi:MAG: carbon-nitrogen family hydrolase [Oscillospiraceae bacterium]|nr:carbon-nitrogen family hydrolase [Oscillospiraceae bacterium]
MKITCIQMDMLFGEPEKNYAHGKELIEQAMREQPDVIVLPETWTTGFFPKRNIETMCEEDGKRLKAEIGALAAKYNVNIVAGSIANKRADKVYNTAYVFDRKGQCIASYDKTHLFTPSHEDEFCTPGDHLCRFTLDGVSCGLIICYDIRFPELTRSMTVPGLDILFVVAQWPNTRTHHLRSLCIARAIENQMFLVCCNSCGTAGKTVHGGNSSVVDPWGETLALAGENEQIISADCDLQILDNIRSTIPVFRDRRPELYNY